MSGEEAMTLRTWLEKTPFTLTLSSGFFGFYAHTGVLSALIEEGLTPAKVTGSSAGALVGSLWASGLEPDQLRHALFELRREDFWDVGFGFGLLRGHLFDSKLRDLLGCQLFEETRVPLKITAFNCFTLRAKVFVEGELAPAIRASCSFPGLFQPVWIDRAPYLDGGITDRSGLKGTSSHERVLYHHLKSRSRTRTAIGLTQLPRRPSTVGLVINHLPKCGPSRLDQGPAAYQKAREQTLCALDRHLDGDPSLRLSTLVMSE